MCDEDGCQRPAAMPRLDCEWHWTKDPWCTGKRHARMKSPQERLPPEQTGTVFDAILGLGSADTQNGHRSQMGGQLGNYCCHKRPPAYFSSLARLCEACPKDALQAICSAEQRHSIQSTTCLPLQFCRQK